MSEKNALAILGSPHTNGTTAAMLNFAVHKAGGLCCNKNHSV